MRKRLICLWLGLLLAACGPGAAAGTLTPAPGTTKGSPLAGGAVLVYHRTGGLEGLDDTWTLFADGSVTHASHDAPAATTPGALPASEVARLVSEVEALGFMGLADAYGQPADCADCFHYTLTVSAGGQTKTVQWLDAADDAPPELWEAVSKVQQVVEGLPPP